MTFELQREPWMDNARCRGQDPNLWFPMRGESQKTARSICAACPVSSECWEYACRTDSAYGIWGGRIVKRGREKNTLSYPWTTLYLTDDLYWDGWEHETGEPFGEQREAV